MRARRTRSVAVLLLLALLIVVWALTQGGASGSGHGRHGGRAGEPAAPSGPGHLQPGSDPSALPGPVLIADEDNNRIVEVDPEGHVLWTWPQPGDLAPGQLFRTPDDAFFSADGHRVIATEENYQAITVIDLATHRIAWRYGTPGAGGSAPGQVYNPDDALLLPNGDVAAADIKNCSLLFLRVGSDRPLETIGEVTQNCIHDPPARWGSPNGMFPLSDGNYLVTEINGDWVDEMTPDGRVLWSTHPPGVFYPSDTNEVSPGVFLTVDWSDPGKVLTFNRNGRLLWEYAPTGAAALDHPSICTPVPTNHDILCTDDHNDRAIVIDPRTNRIVWQYGHTGVEGTAPGYLSGPDGLDLAPPYSLMAQFARTAGVPPQG